MTARTSLRNHAFTQEAKRLLSDQRIAFPAGLALTAALSISNRKLCRVWHRDGYWEYRWREGTSFIEHPKLSVTLADPTNFADILFWDYEPKADDIVVDVGAGLGGELLALRTRVGPRGQVFGFEANPVTFAKLSQLCELNRWTNVETIHAAVVDQAKPVFISDSQDYQTNNVFSSGGYQVEGVALDDFVVQRDISQIDYLYMNIEGAERLAIRGMEEVARITDHICISCHDFLGTEWGSTSEEVRAWLKAKGFRVLGPPEDPRPQVQFFVYGSKR